LFSRTLKRPLLPPCSHFCSLDRSVPCVAGYATSVAYVLITMLLFHVQQDMVRAAAGL
jgi:hypothetical protein